MNTIQIIGLIGMFGYFIVIGVRKLRGKMDFDTVLGFVAVSALLISGGWAFIEYPKKQTETPRLELTEVNTAKLEQINKDIDSLDVIFQQLNERISRLSSVRLIETEPFMGALHNALSEYHEKEHRKEAIKQQIRDLRKELNSIQ